jgi:hypothetical protein
MGKGDKKSYLEAIRGRYRKASRADKSKILDEFCAVCHYRQRFSTKCANGFVSCITAFAMKSRISIGFDFSFAGLACAISV